MHTINMSGGFCVTGIPPEQHLNRGARAYVWDANLASEAVPDVIHEAEEAGWIDVRSAEQTRGPQA